MKYVSYVRVSTRQQGDSGLGLEAQRSYINHFFPNIEREFLEVKSGKNITDRPILKQAMKFCKDNGHILVVAKVDRLTRNAEEGLSMWREMDGNIRFCDLPGVPDKFMLTLFFAFGERERELISIRTRDGLAKSKKPKGTAHPTGNRAAWKDSYREASIKARMLKAKSNPEFIRAKALASGLSESNTLKQIADKLNEAGFSTLSGKGSWGKGMVHRLING